MSSSQWFCGWFVYRIGGKFYATRHGVRINTNSRFGIKRMIVLRNREERAQAAHVMS